jgi:hypothetical protein
MTCSDGSDHMFKNNLNVVVHIYTFGKSVRFNIDAFTESGCSQQALIKAMCQMCPSLILIHQQL